ncbi:GntR family transcriptional regulator [Caballeronia sp. AZ10_KS36]|uniref:GntR family transcriptional regulator n=1 Tax=Caballeronia sp. AZ10_KS36 TaxID=2921757 RepID=UPI0020293819|nr:GntR family transcriptional regulator [Caballeronia sp. AZ10_KS36]
MSEDDWPPQSAVANGPLRGSVYGSIKAEILELRLLAGAPLQEEELASHYGVSRTPVREALRQLLDEGFVERKGRFYQVKHLTPRDIRELYEVRESLETTAVRLCVERADDVIVARLHETIAGQVEALAANDRQRFSACDTAFHLTLAEGASNGLLLQQLTAIHEKIRLTRGREYEVRNWLRHSIDEHSRVVSALERRDATIGVAEMTYHIRSVVDLHFGTRRRKD